MYRLNDLIGTAPILNYTFNTDPQLLFRQLTDLPVSIAASASQKEFHLMNEWAAFARLALGEDEYADSKLVCWHGHYEQFGLVMLAMMHLSKHKEDTQDHAEHVVIPNLEDCTFIAEPAGTADRLFYRLWFRLIGHPDFTVSPLQSADFENENYWSYVMGLALSRINDRLTRCGRY